MSNLVNNKMVNNNENMEDVKMENVNVNVNVEVSLEEVVNNEEVAEVFEPMVVKGYNYKGARTRIDLNGHILNPNKATTKSYCSLNANRRPLVAYSFSAQPSNQYKEYLSLNDHFDIVEAAHERCRYEQGISFPDALHKELWKALYAYPERIVLYAFKINKKSNKIIKFALRHGIKVTLFEDYCKQRWDFNYVANEFLNPLNQDLIVTSQAEYDELMTARNAVRNITWTRLNAETSLFTSSMYANRLENNREDILYAQRVTVEGLLLQAHEHDILPTDVTPERVMWDKTLQDHILRGIRIYAKAYGLPGIVTTQRESNVNSFYIYDPQYTNDDPGYAGNEKDPYEEKILKESEEKAGVKKQRADIYRNTFKTYKDRIRMCSQDVNWVDAISQYIQIAYYDLTGGLDVWGVEGYVLCENCGCPVSVGVETDATISYYSDGSMHYESLDGERICEHCGTAPKRTGLVYTGLFTNPAEVDITSHDFDVAPVTDVTDGYDEVYQIAKPNIQVRL